MDNPNYEESIKFGPLQAETYDHVYESYDKDFQNSVYSEIGPSSLNTTNTPIQSIYNVESKMANEILYQTCSSVPGSSTSKEGDTNGGMTGGSTSEAIYDVPSTLDNIDDDNCYSALGPGDYFTLQPHISKHTQQQFPPADNEYSLLHHLNSSYSQ